MCSESKSWRPAHWKETKRRQFCDDVHRHTEWQLEQFLGAYDGAKWAAELKAQRRASQSLERLRAAGVATIGDTQ